MFVAIATLLLEPVAAWAHAKLVKSEPAQRAVLTKPPSQLRLWFNERLEPAFCIATVVDASGKSVTSTEAAVSNTDRGRVKTQICERQEMIFPTPPQLA